MTVEEAKVAPFDELLFYIKYTDLGCYCIEEHCYLYNSCAKRIAYDRIKEALEKQTQKKPYFWNNKKYICPNCHRAEYLNNEPLWSYCGFCGQRLDRSDEQ